MGIAHIGDDGHIGAHHVAQVADLVKMIHARFNDSGLMGIIKAQQRLGRADGVIEVGLRFQRGKLLAQH